MGDSSFAALEWLASLSQLPTAVHLVTRFRLDAALYAPALERQPKQSGHPRQVGKRLATLQSLLEMPQTAGQALTVEGGYGGRTCDLQVTAPTAVW